MSNTRHNNVVKAFNRQTQCSMRWQCITPKRQCIQCLRNDLCIGTVDYYDDYELRYLRRKEEQR